MQHPDEGMIHSWLDGALSAEEAARVDSHVSDCASCAAAVAEARGFIAASSRILTALDDVPRGVLPAAPAKTRDFRIVWRAAAAMLVVAGGSLVVMREGGQDVSIPTAAVTSGAADQATVARTASVPVTETAESAREASPLTSADAATTPPAPAAPPVASARRAESLKQSELSTGADLARPKASVGNAAGASVAAGAATGAAAPGALRMQMNEATSDGDPAPLKVVSVERTSGSRRTIYQVTPSEIVTLTEPEADSTPGTRIVLRGRVSPITTGQTAARGTSSAPTSAEAAKAPPPPPPSAMMDSKAAAFSAAANTITWIESGTGKTLTLSGNVSVERLQEIRKLIEARNRLPATRLP